jgi:hypothetical protein
MVKTLFAKKAKYKEKSSNRHLVSASATSVLAFSALTKDTPNPKTARPDSTRDRNVGLEQRFAERTARLQISSQELEAFS